MQFPRRRAAVLISLLLLPRAAHAQAPSFNIAPGATPTGWAIKDAAPGSATPLQQPRDKPLTLNTTAPVALPVEAEFRLQLGSGDTARLTVGAVGDAKTPALLDTTLFLYDNNSARVRAMADGAPMAAEAVQNRGWPERFKKVGWVTYAWRYPRVRNNWDERDRQEIGAAYSGLTPFAAKTFVLRVVLASASRQIWLDDRLVAEAQVATPAAAHFSLDLSRTVRLLAADFTTSNMAAPYDATRWLPLHLQNRWAPAPQKIAEPLLQLKERGQLPLYLSATGAALDLGQSLYRFRTSAGSGPFNGYINAQAAHPDPFTIDPAEQSFRVPYRNYQTAWLVVWLDNKAPAVPRGVLRFYRDSVGRPAATAFAVDADAIKSGLAVKLPRQPMAGKTLYLVKVPLDTDAMNAYRDQSDQFLDFQITKPTIATRTYPDPIYYGDHPGGPPSSINVVAVTLEIAPFPFEVQPGEVGNVFEAPAKPTYKVQVANSGAAPLAARVSFATRSFDGTEKTVGERRVAVASGKNAETDFSLDLQKNGWHELQIKVEAGGATRTQTLSLVRLPRNARTYGNATNETRFGTWALVGHYLPIDLDRAANEPWLAMLRKLGIRRLNMHASFIDPAIAKKLDFLAGGTHTVGTYYGDVDVNDPVALQKAVDAELKSMERELTEWPTMAYMYGGEWPMSREAIYAPDPRYTGDGARELTAEEEERATRQGKIFVAVGKTLRRTHPGIRLSLQWGGPQTTVPFLRKGFPKELIDSLGMDLPVFEQLPEFSGTVSPINLLWTVRQEAARLGYDKYPIDWTEGPFFPTNPGALTEADQAAYQVRSWLMGLAYGVDVFDCGIVAFDAANYYGSEHYGQGVFHPVPLNCPKPAVAAAATATSMLCGADPTGGVPTGNLSTYCLGFRRAKAAEADHIYALWRVRGAVNATLKVANAAGAQLTDGMGNTSRPALAADGRIVMPVGEAPVWLTGAGTIDSITLGEPRYTDKPAPITRALPAFTGANWRYDGSEDAAYATNHFAIRRVTDPQLQVDFTMIKSLGNFHPRAVVKLPVQPGDRPLANRYGALVATTPITLPGAPSAVGVTVYGNASWGRIAYELRDAHGETWLSTGTKDEWNCDDTHGWQSINFEGKRYMRFPLPGNRPWDAAREQESTWWGSRHGDGIVDYPLTLTKIFVEARNEVPYLSEMQTVPQRSYALEDLCVEYATAEDATPAAAAARAVRMPVPPWQGPQENPIARLAAGGTLPAPAAPTFTEPAHFNDGRRMVLHFTAQPGHTYNLYLSLYPDGRGGELLQAGVRDNQEITGLRPDLPHYLFLAAVDDKKQESKPSPATKLVTRDNFAEK